MKSTEMTVIMNRDCDRRTFLKTAGLGTASALIPVSFIGTGCDKKKKSNVLFIAVDDLRPQLGCYGHHQTISPNIDRLASTGTVFERTYCQVPVCGASRASLLMGIRPTRTRFVDFKTMAEDDLPNAASLPKYLKEHGYHTVSNGKIFHHNNDYQDSWCEVPWRPTGDWVGRGYLSEKNKSIAEGDDQGRGPAFEKYDVSDHVYPDGRLTDKTIADMNRLKEIKNPFFLAVGYLKPHLPFNAPKRFWDLYERENIDLADNPFRPKGAPDVALHNWGELRNYYGIPKKGPLSDDLARTLVHGYYACVSYTDHLIGRLLVELKHLGLDKNTITVLWGDHGWNLGEHGLWCKHCNFETSLHSPLIISSPWHGRGKRTEALTEFVDIYPTICDLCEMPIDGHLEGQSMVPLLENPERPWKGAVYSRYKDGDSVKTDRYRYTEWTRENGEVYARMLYDHKKDPFENVNIAEYSENKALVEKLSIMLHGG